MFYSSKIHIARFDSIGANDNYMKKWDLSAKRGLSQHRFLIKSLLFSFAAVLPSYASATDDSVINDLLKLIEQKAYQQAYDLGEKVFDDYAGEAEFDYLYALSAKQIGEYQRAIFAFERVTLNHPGNLNAKLALAIAYYDLANYKAAQRELEDALLLNPSEQQSEKINRYIELISQRIKDSQKRWLASLELGLGYDDNINSGIDENNELGLSEGTGEGAALALFKASLAYQYPLTKSSRLYFQSQFKQSSYQGFSQYQKRNLDFVTGYKSKDDDFAYGFSVFAQPFWVGGDKYQDMLGIKADTTWFWHNKWSSSLNLNVMKNNHKSNDELDLQVNNLSLSLAYKHKTSKHNFAFNLGQDKVDNKAGLFRHYDKSQWGLSYAYQRFIANEFIFSAGSSYTNAEYDRLHPIFNHVFRHDKTTQFNSSLSYIFDSNWLWNNQVLLSYKQSNLALYDYDRQLVISKLQYRF